MREFESEGFRIIEYGDPRGVEYLVLSLPDLGLVGSITGLHLIRSLNLNPIVGIQSPPYMPPAVVVKDGKPGDPMRIYSGKGIGVLVTDVPLAPTGLYPLSRMVVDYAVKALRVKAVIGVTGIGSPARLKGESPKVYYAASAQAGDLAEASGVEPLREGILVGPYALILSEAQRVGLPALVLLAESYAEFPDPEAAAEAVKTLSRVTGVEVGVEALLEEAEVIKARLRELMRETRDVMARMGKGVEYRTPLVY